MTLAEARQLPPRPWLNGLGSTRSLAECSDDAGGADSSIAWRLSLADIDGAVEFSRFDGVERQLLVVEGLWIDLEIGGVSTRAETDQAVGFAGETPVRAVGVPESQSVRVLNLMTTRTSGDYPRRSGTITVEPTGEWSGLPAVDRAIVVLVRLDDDRTAVVRIAEDDDEHPDHEKELS